MPKRGVAPYLYKQYAQNNPRQTQKPYKVRLQTQGKLTTKHLRNPKYRDYPFTMN